jgi:hypothetical protein
LQHDDPRIERRKELPCLDTEEPLVLEDHPWARSYVLRGLTGALGYRVVGADCEPGHDELFLLGVLAQETGSALGAVRALTDQRRTNHELQQVVQRLEHQTETMRVLAGVAAEETDGAHLASSLSSLTGLPVSVEDHFGHRLSWASPFPAAAAAVTHRLPDRIGSECGRTFFIRASKCRADRVGGSSPSATVGSKHTAQLRDVGVSEHRGRPCCR